MVLIEVNLSMLDAKGHFLFLPCLMKFAYNSAIFQTGRTNELLLEIFLFRSNFEPLFLRIKQ